MAISEPTHFLRYIATHLRGGRIFYYRFTLNLLLSLSVKEWKSVSIWQS